MIPNQLDFFKKKSGSLQFTLIPAKPDDKDYAIEGYIFIEAASCLPNEDRCDWNKKVKMKLGLVDLATILTGVKTNEPVKLYHKTETTIATLNIEQGITSGTFKIFITSEKDGVKNSFSSFLDKKEMYTLMIMFETAMPRILGWL